MSMDERMTVCNMSIEGGARVGYVNPDETTFKYIEGRPFAPQGDAFAHAKTWWRSMASDADASYDDEVEIRAAELTPVVTWGVNPGSRLGSRGKFQRQREPISNRSPMRCRTWGCAQASRSLA
jgi:3-isopropylmalate/(R)-2-methylmalate dehydratase large subunit